MLYKTKSLRDLSDAELQAELSDTKKEHFKILNESKQTKKLEKPHLMKLHRRKVARIHTLLHERAKKKEE